MAHWGKRMLSCCRKIRETNVNDIEESETTHSAYRALRAAAWASVALGVTALGLFVGYELRVRYKFNRRTPSDFYSHAGEELGAEFGMGI
jgi:hypothetical protein